MALEIRDRKLWFYGGVRTDVTPDRLEDFESPLVENVDPSADDFAAERRKGYTNLSAAVVTPNGSQGGSGIFAWINPANNTEHILIAEGQKLYKAPAVATDVPVDITPTTWTPTADTEVTFMALKNVVIIMAKGVAPHKYDGTTVSSLGGSPPTDLWHGVVFGGRIFSPRQNSPNHNVLRWCAIGEPENWDLTTYADDAGQQVIGDGSPIVGLLAAGDLLYIFKEREAWFMTGGVTALAFNFRPFSDAGLVSPFGVTSFDGLPVWASHASIQTWDPSRGPGEFSRRIYPTYFDVVEKRSISLVTYKDKVLAFYPTTSSRYQMDRAAVVRVRRQRWGFYAGTFTNVRAVRRYVATDGTERLIAVTAPTSGGNQVRIRRLDNGTDDAGTAISMVCETRDITFDHRLGRLLTLVAETDNEASTLTIRRYLNGVLQAAVTPTWQSSTGSPTRRHARVGKMPIEEGFSFRIRLEESVLGAGIGRLHSVSFDARSKSERSVPV